jgi:D-glycero-alpha-D-manno-heptose-7-phosphate kinase
MMRVARAPVRITLGGGGTDYPSHYRRFGGNVVGLAIDRYVSVTVATRPWVRGVEFRSATYEDVNKAADLRHDLARATLEEVGVSEGVQIVVAEDIPPGTGVGSSSAFVVALLAAATAVTGAAVEPLEIAARACVIERERLGRDVGKQDQYLSALGGMQALTFNPDDTTVARDVSPDGRLATALAVRIRLYWNGRARLGHQARNAQVRALAQDEGARERHDATVKRLAEIGLISLAALEAGDFDAWGDALHEHWVAKRELGVPNASLPDALYDRLRRTAAVSGGKLMGAGSHGVVLLYCRDDGSSADRIMAREGFVRIDFGASAHGVAVLNPESGSQW